MEKLPELMISKEEAKKIDEVFVGIDENGKEWPDQTPMAVKPKFGVRKNATERMRQMINQIMDVRAREQEFETEEEANDFDVDDGWEVSEPTTKYEMLEEEYLEDNYVEARPEAEDSKSEAVEDPAVSEEQSEGQSTQT